MRRPKHQIKWPLTDVTWRFIANGLNPEIARLNITVSTALVKSNENSLHCPACRTPATVVASRVIHLRMPSVRKLFA